MPGKKAYEDQSSTFPLPLQEHSNSRIVQIVFVIPAVMQAVVRIAVFTLTKLYHATHGATRALRFASLRPRSHHSRT